MFKIGDLIFYPGNKTNTYLEVLDIVDGRYVLKAHQPKGSYTLGDTHSENKLTGFRKYSPVLKELYDSGESHYV